MRGLDDIQRIVWESVVKALGPYAPVNPDRLVRFSWAKDGQPWFKLGDTAVVLNLYLENDLLSQPKFYEDIPPVGDEESGSRIYHYTRVWKLSVDIYGPESISFATYLSLGITFPAVREILAREDLDLGKPLQGPTRRPEVINSKWWDKVTLDIFLNEKVVLNPVTQPYIKSAEISIDAGRPTGNSNSNTTPTPEGERPGSSPSQVPASKLPVADREFQGGVGIHVSVIKS